MSSLVATGSESTNGDSSTSGTATVTRCAGCQKVVDNKKLLICPTCVKLGNKDLKLSTFCSQECFKSNWKTHKLYHESGLVISIPSPSNQGIGTSGVRVIHDESNTKLGRILISTRSYQPGDIVLEEDPLVIFRIGWPDLLNKYTTSMTIEEKEKLLDMQHLTSIEEAKHDEFSRSIKQSFDHAIVQPVMQELLKLNQSDEAFAFRLCTLVNINGHMYQMPTNHSVGTQSNQQQQEDERLTALFYLGSKATHSCDPNTAYSSKCNSSGKLTYYAIKPIAEGEIITFSYINTPFLTSTRERRQQLKKTKDFLCQCSFCLSPDILTAVKCSKASCKGYRMLVVQDKMKEGSDKTGILEENYALQCSICGPCSDTDSTLGVENLTVSKAKGKAGSKSKSNSITPTERLQQFQDKFHSIQAVAGMQGISPDLCDHLEKLLEEVRSTANGIGTCHSLVMEILQVLATFLESSASIVDEIAASTGGGGVNNANSRYLLMSRDYRKRSADALLQLTKLIECVHANCPCSTNDDNCSTNHPVAPGCEQYILSAAKHYITAKATLPVAQIEKYKPYMILSYGVNDMDVKDVCKALSISSTIATSKK